MRPFLALLTATLILGGLQGYFLLRDRFGPTSVAAIERPAPGVYALEIKLTFDAGPDPFALDAADKTCLEVVFRGKRILSRKEAVAAGEKVIISPVAGMVAGTDAASGSNEFLVKATPAESRPESAYAARVRVLRDGAPITEQSLWSENDGKVEGKIVAVVIESSAQTHAHHAESPKGAKP